MEFSPTYLTSLVIIIVGVLQVFKINVAQEEMQKYIEALAILIGGIIVLYRRLKYGGITVLGIKK
jgi:hypothetical protein